MVVIHPFKKCEDCLKKYRKTHTCNIKKVSYAEAILKKKGRVLLSNSKHDEYNNHNDIIHYDLETVPTGPYNIHIPYIVGYNEGNEFKTFRGDSCMKDFVDFLISKNDKGIKEMEDRLKLNKPYIALCKEKEKENEKKKKIIIENVKSKEYTDIQNTIKILSKKITSIKMAERKKIKPCYLNAFNGANFDHYFIFKEFIKRGLKPSNQIINNGSVIKFEYGAIKMLDLCKHVSGSLKQNLKSFNCKILKGDFDHKKASRWEVMSEELRDKCVKYLHSDVMGLKELYEKVNTVIFDRHQINITKYISTSSLSFNLWKQWYSDLQQESIDDKNTQRLDFIKLPTLDQEKAFRQSIRGGRTYKSKHRFKSEQFDGYIEGKTSFDEIEDYLIDADVVSLYPTAMADFEYPIGDCERLPQFIPDESGTNNTPFDSQFVSGDQKQTRGKMGIYEIEYKANKNLMHSIGGRRSEDGGLKWDLKDGEGWYTSIDIEDMKANGYEITIKDGYYWTKTAMVFRDFIKDLFKNKENAVKGSVQYALAKLFMNALYGKMIQRPIYSNSQIISTNSEYWKFWGKNNITGVEKLDELWMLTGVSKELKLQERCITKPTHLGAFVLAYSRRIMMGYIKEANPYFDSMNMTKKIENDFYYTDTDSLQMHVKNARLMQNLGNKQLGGITDDLGDGCKIIRGIWIAPKLYMLEFTTESAWITGNLLRDSDELEVIDKHTYTKSDISHLGKGVHIQFVDTPNGPLKRYFHFRGKGLNKGSLTIKSFEDMDSGKSLTNVRDFQMKKIHITRNSKQQSIPQFSIVHYSSDNAEDKQRLTKVVNSTAWAGRLFRGNDSLPHLI